MTTSQRDDSFDNLKGFLIFFVVFGHLIQFTRGKTEPWIGYLYTAIYLFHMPLFVFISGYFSKRIRAKRTVELFFVYALWQLIISPLTFSLLTKQPYELNWTSLFAPTNHHWYLFSLMTWRIFLPFVSRIKGCFWWSCLIGVLSGLLPILAIISPASSDLSILSLSRTLGFFPFFLWGYFFTPDQAQRLRQRSHPICSCLLFLVIVSLGWWGLQQHTDDFIKPSMINKILFMREGYAAFLKDPRTGVALRLQLYVIQMSLIGLALSGCPTKTTAWTQFGKHSFFIFLSHVPLILAFKPLYLDHQPTFKAWWVLGISLTVTFLYCQLCCTKPVVAFARMTTTLPNSVKNAFKGIQEKLNNSNP